MSKPYVPLALREKVILRARGRCEYCHSPVLYSPEVFEVEHIVPQSAAGPTTLSNLAWACPACNRYKGNRRSAIDPTTGQGAPLFNPRNQEWTSHFRWSDDLAQIIGLTSSGRATVELLRMNRPAVCHFRSALRELGLHPAIAN